MKTKKLKLESGIEVEVYKSKIRGTWINAVDCTTEYNDFGKVVYDKNNRPPKD